MKRLLSRRQSLNLTLMLLPMALLAACVTRADVRGPSGRIIVDEDSVSFSSGRGRGKGKRYASDDDDDDDY